MARVTSNPREYAALVNAAAGLPRHTVVLQGKGTEVSAPNGTVAVIDIREDGEGNEYFEVDERVRTIVEKELATPRNTTAEQRTELQSRTPVRDLREEPERERIR